MNRVATLTSHIAADPSDRAVIVTGTRTPFVRGHNQFLKMNTIDLGCAAVKGLIDRTKLDPNAIDHMVWGSVILPIGAPNVAREIIIDMKLPHKIAAHTVTQACASGLQAVVNAAMLIEGGAADVVIAGGSDSMSGGELPLPQHVTHALALYSQGKIGTFKFLSSAGSPCSWMPKPPAIAERSTGNTMGYHADVSCELMGVSREAQDAFAISSHAKAASAARSGLLADELVPVGNVNKDLLVRAKIDPKKVASLKPVFRKAEKGGTVNAANASPLTDGAAAVLVMSAKKAKALGYAADVAIRAFAMSGINPQPNLLLAPAIAIPLALKRANLRLDQIDFFEIHEAFAGQVLSTIAVLDSEDLSQKYLGQPRTGKIALEKVNIHGGSVSIGHPFGATGARITTNAARILRANAEAKYVLASVCAAGGLGLVTIFEKI